MGLKRVADYWHAVIRINDYQKHRFVETVIGSMFNTVSGKKIALLGFAFKKVRGAAACVLTPPGRERRLSGCHSSDPFATG